MSTSLESSTSGTAVAGSRAKVKLPLDPGMFAAHRRVSSWKSAILLATCYVAFAGILWGFVLLSEGAPWFAILGLGMVAFVLISAIQGHMSILLHEGAHFLLHPHKATNNILAELAGIPLLFTARNYRTLHLAHHEFSGDPERDPERQIYRSQQYTYLPQGSWKHTLNMLCRDLFLINAIHFLMAFQRFLKSRPNHPLLTLKEGLWFVALHGLPLGIALWSGHALSFLVLWYGPLFTLTFFFLKLHIYGEHTGKSGPTEYERTWHHDPHPILDFFVYPIRSGFHLEHHLYPAVPWYHMKSFRAELIKHEEFLNRQAAVHSDGYFRGKNTIWRAMIHRPKGTSKDEAPSTS